SPFKAPATINNVTGFPKNRKTKVEMTINEITIIFVLLWIDLCSVFKKVALVYADPITEDIAAANNTTPNIFRPIGPNTCSNTEAGGLVSFKVTPVTTTPSTAKNNNALSTPVVNIPEIAALFTNGK